MANRIKVLFLQSQIPDLFYLRGGDEVREIENKIYIAPNAESFELISKWAVRPNDLVTALMKHQPTIVHFSGHADKDGIILENDSGEMRPISGQQLEKMFSFFKETIRLVVLNTCYSEPQLAGLSRIIDYTVGTSSALSDGAAIQFAGCFYQSLAFGYSVQDALDFAKCQVDMEGLKESEIFTLRIREGVDASEPLVKRKSGRKTSSKKMPSRASSIEQVMDQNIPIIQESVPIPSRDLASNRRHNNLRPTNTPQRPNNMRNSDNEKIPHEIRESLQRFKVDYPDLRKVAFLMMRFGKTKAHKSIVTGIRKALDPLGITVVRADDKQYHDDLFPNVLTYVYGCAFGIAVFERIETEEFNPNVALEVGYMFALKKHICLLKDKSLKTLHADLVGKLYRVFDPLDPIGTIPEELSQWLKDKGLYNPAA